MVTHWFCHGFGGSICEKCALKTCLLIGLQMWFDFGDGDDGCNDDDSSNNDSGTGGDGDDVSRVIVMVVVVRWGMTVVMKILMVGIGMMEMVVTEMWGWG